MNNIFAHKLWFKEELIKENRKYFLLNKNGNTKDQSCRMPLKAVYRWIFISYQKIRERHKINDFKSMN